MYCGANDNAVLLSISKDPNKSKKKKKGNPNQREAVMSTRLSQPLTFVRQ